MYSISGSICIDKCGDGFRNTLPCDDGNVLDGDGCSSDCKIEQFYTCQIINSQEICRYNGACFSLILHSINRVDG